MGLYVTDPNGKLVKIAGGIGSSIIVDANLDENSVNPVQNKVITRIINTKANQSAIDELIQTINTKANQSAVDELVQTINTKADTSYVDQKVTDLVGAAPSTLDTLEELANALKDNADVVDVLEKAIGDKADKTALTELSNVVNTKATMSEIASAITFAESERQKSKNLLITPYASGSKTENGLTFTANKDGSIRIQGTASATTYYTFVTSPKFVRLENKKYSLSVRDINGAIASSVRLELWQNGNQSTLKNGYGYITDTFVEADYNDIYMSIPKNTTLDVTVYPQLELGEITEWQQYNGAITHNNDAPVAFAESERLKSKNLFDIDLQNSLGTNYYLEVVEGAKIGVYSSVGNASNLYFQMIQYDENKTHIVTKNYWNSKAVIKLDPSTKYLRFSTVIDWNTFMVCYANSVDEIGEYQAYNGAIVHEKNIYPNIMTTMLAATYNFSAPDTSEKLPMELYNNVGNKLTFLNNNIVIGPGVSKIKASYHATIDGSEGNSQVYVYLMKNGSIFINNALYFNQRYQTPAINSTDILIDVQEGDVFGIYGRVTSINNAITGSLTTKRTYLTIEVVL